MSIFNMVGCGGGSSLNYEVVGGTSAPSSPSVNTIWINTSTDITSHIFSATQPTNPASGMVWITVGASSVVAFSATEENPVMVYPISAKQYVGGAWVDKTAKSYQGGKWVEWIPYLYNSGDECVDITGGWQGRALKAEPSYSAATPTVTKNANSITAKVTNGGGVLEVKKDIDLTNVKKLFFDVSGINRPANYNGLAVIVFDRSLTSTGNDSSTADGYYAKCKAFCMFPVGGTAGEYSLDVSSITGLNDIGIHMYHASGSAGITLNKMWMAY